MKSSFKLAHIVIGLTAGVTLSPAWAGNMISEESFSASFGNQWFNNTADDSHDWRFNTYGTPSSNTGPSSGASRGADGYVYLETSSGAAYSAGSTAILEGPELEEGHYRLDFKVHRYGSDIGTLEVQARTYEAATGTWEWVTRISDTGQFQTSSSELWLEHSVSFETYEIDRIRFKATAAGGWEGDIAIDDIALYTSGPNTTPPSLSEDGVNEIVYQDTSVYIDLDDYITSGSEYFVSWPDIPAWLSLEADNVLSGSGVDAMPGLLQDEIEIQNEYGTIALPITIDVVDRVAPTLVSSESFGEGVDPVWTLNSDGDTNAWQYKIGSTSSANTGPEKSPADDQYVYFETSSGYAYTIGNSSSLKSNSFLIEGALIEFQYHMYGSNTGSLILEAKVDNEWVQVWAKEGQQHASSRDPFSKETVELGNLGQIQQLRFLAIAQGGFMGDIAVDEISIAGYPVAQPDTDGDGYHDEIDAFPDDPSEWVDSDGDGTGDNSDVFPTDPTEIADSDWDGTGDNADVFPGNPNEWQDSDSDGVGDNGDVFPTDPTEWADSDFDGYGDNGDAFPNDPGEWLDTDNDGIGNNTDEDDDNDGIPDVDDTNPLTPDTGAYIPPYELVNLQVTFIDATGPFHTEVSDHIGLFGYNNPALDGVDYNSLTVEWSGQLVVNRPGTYVAGPYSNIANVVEFDLDGPALVYNPLQLGAGTYDFALVIDGLQGDSNFQFQFYDTSENPPGDQELAAVLQQLMTDQTAVIYASANHPQDKYGNINVTFEATQYPVILFLSTFEGMGWDIDIPDDVEVAAIVANANMAPPKVTVNQDVPIYQYSFLTAESNELSDDAIHIENMIGTEPHLYYGNEAILGWNPEINQLLTIERCEYYCGLDPNEPLDSDRDGIFNNVDTDDDNDGYPDTNDDFPLDSKEWVDTDGDSIGNNADQDDDNDGVTDRNDEYPLDSSEAFDSDNDGLGNSIDTDDDNDGVPDVADDFSLDPNASSDSDFDGIDDSVDTLDNGGPTRINNAYDLYPFQWDIYAGSHLMTTEYRRVVDLDYPWDYLYGVDSPEYSAVWKTKLETANVDQLVHLDVTLSWASAEVSVNGVVIDSWSTAGSVHTTSFVIQPGVTDVEIRHVNNWHTTSFQADFR